MTKNGMAEVLKVVAWLIMIIGFIGSIILARVEVETGSYYPHYETKFDITIFLTAVCSCAITGVCFLGFAEVLTLLQKKVDQTNLILKHLGIEVKQEVSNTLPPEQLNTPTNGD